MRGGELVIRTRREADDVVHQFIPRVKLKGDFPVHIVENRLHWLDVSSGDLELRDLGNLWPEKRLRSWFIPNSDNVLELGQSELLLDVRSSTTSMITSVLSPLESGKFIDVRYSSKTGGVSAHLPRLKLDFFINPDGELGCRQFPGMVVDRDQNIGTLVGLENRLVVHQASVRSVIIPYGNVNFQACDNHIKARIDTGDHEKVKYHIYTIDTRLGRLVGNGSLASHLYRIFLHAVTAYCLPDPLTRGTGTDKVLAGRTGTEEALAGLRAAVTWSFQTLDTKGVEADLLRLIASLTPGRVYYPPHLEVMQRVDWNCLSAVAQHDEFHAIVSAVFAHASRFHIFQEGSKGSETLNYLEETSNQHLLKRAAIRNASYRTEEFGGSLVTNSEDSIYSARDVAHDSKDEARVWHVSDMVARWPSKMNICSRLMDVLEDWGEIGGLRAGLELGYDRTWLTQNLADVWCELYKAFHESSQQRHTYQLMFLLSALSYSGEVDLQLIETLVAFATVPKFRYLTLPTYPSYNLKQGFSPSRDVLSTAVKGCVRGFEGSDEASLSTRYNESAGDLARRRYQTYEENTESQSMSYVDNLISKWPCAAPSSPSGDYRLLDTFAAMAEVTPLFESWYWNKKFKEHVEEVQDALNSINSEDGNRPQLYSFDPCGAGQCSVPGTIRLEDLLGRDAPVLTDPPGLHTPTPTDPFGDSTPTDHLATTVRSRNAGQKVREWLMGQMRKARGISYTKSASNCSSKEATPEPPTSKDQLDSLLQEFQSRSSTGFQTSYADGLLESFKALHDQDQGTSTENLQTALESVNSECQKYLEDVFGAILQSLMPLGQTGELMAYRAGLWPRISPMSLLQLLSGNGSIGLSLGWRHVLVSYGEAITMLQRSERLLSHAPGARGNSNSDFAKEIENIGHQKWDPMQQSDWLLVEIENNFLVRPVQAEIASKMIAPPSDKNTVMQLFMGEGKTSVIVPIVAAALADSKKLVRVIVLKPLSGQMFQMLVQKLGGLVNRRIFYMPFSREVAMTQEKARLIRLLYEECMQSGGILLVQPEHILSFALVGLEWLHNSTENKKVNQGNKDDEITDSKVAEMLIDTQRWLGENSRDILDESDEIMNVRHELIYTIGSSKHIENHPDRWVIVQEIFDLIQRRLSSGGFGPPDLEVETLPDHHGCFPFTRILNEDAGRQLLGHIASQIIAGNITASLLEIEVSRQRSLSLTHTKPIAGGLPTVSFRLLPDEVRRLASKFITDPSMSKEESEPLLDYCGENDISKATLHLLRGLIAHNILLFSLKDKRWRVDYGLDPKRSMLAVPYRAKDAPAVKAEFSHPDVAITLTCLSYYYGGLTESDLEVCFRNLYKSDNPPMEYERWLKGVPTSNESFKRLNGINLLDKEQWKNEIVPMFRYNKSVIDFYLSGVVFPKEAKEFDHKLSTSSWDIAAEKSYPTTGFSGTNDNRYLLPLSITQSDSPEQLNTNAQVLSYLLQPENSYIQVEGANGERLKVRDLLGVLNKPNQEPQIRVLLDVGAQVLELQNHEVAEEWLKMVPEAQAAVFFSDGDELTVMSRDGTTEPLMISAFAKQLEDCLVYLDEAHTRGTDLKLPINSRAAVTLGPNLTKDRLVQG